MFMCTDVRCTGSFSICIPFNDIVKHVFFFFHLSQGAARGLILCQLHPRIHGFGETDHLSRGKTGFLTDQEVMK